MTLILDTAPSDGVVSLDEVKQHVRVDSSDDDNLMSIYIQAATRKLDGRDGLLGRCLLTQTWRLLLDRFPAQIDVPLPPCRSVDSINYIDAAGETQTLAPENYQVAGLNSADGVRIVPAYGKCWPTIGTGLEKVTVTFTAGYGDDAADVPEPIRTAIMMHAALLYDNRESVVVGNETAVELPQGSADLIADFRVWTF